MKTTFVSSHAMHSMLRDTTLRAQVELTRAEREVVTGRHADLGIALAGQSGRAVSLRADVARMEALIDSNALVTKRMSATQSALSQMAEGAQTALNALITTSTTADRNQIGIARTDIANALNTVISAANLTAGGEHLFGGLNTAEEPLAGYTPASPAKAGFDAAFLARFGFAQGDPAAAGITAAQMQDFLANDVPALFTPAQWQTDWSNATDETMTSRIDKHETVTSSVSANAEGIRTFAMAAVVGIELLDTAVSDEVRTLINGWATAGMGSAIAGIDEERARLGISEARVAGANEMLDMQIDIVSAYVGELEGVDTYEASTRVSMLETQIEAAYSLTARLQRLSLLNYL